jgi:hypothetical protein
MRTVLGRDSVSRHPASQPTHLEELSAELRISIVIATPKGGEGR